MVVVDVDVGGVASSESAVEDGDVPRFADVVIMDVVVVGDVGPSDDVVDAVDVGDVSCAVVVDVGVVDYGSDDVADDVEAEDAYDDDAADVDVYGDVSCAGGRRPTPSRPTPSRCTCCASAHDRYSLAFPFDLAAVLALFFVALVAIAVHSLELAPRLCVPHHRRPRGRRRVRRRRRWAATTERSAGQRPQPVSMKPTRSAGQRPRRRPTLMRAAWITHPPSSVVRHRALNCQGWAAPHTSTRSVGLLCRSRGPGTFTRWRGMWPSLRGVWVCWCCSCSRCVCVLLVVVAVMAVVVARAPSLAVSSSMLSYVSPLPSSPPSSSASALVFVAVGVGVYVVVINFVIQLSHRHRPSSSV